MVRRCRGYDQCGPIASGARPAFHSDDGIAQLSAGLLFAGHETTVAAIDRGVLLLATNQDQRSALQADASLIETAVEEILRYPDPLEPADSVAPVGLPRYAHAVVQVDGVTIKAGELVLLALYEANLDSAVFDQSDEFDIRRTDNPHLTFGHGARYCLGAPLARIELQCVLATLVGRVPSLRLAVPLDALRPKSHLLTGGLMELPVTW